MPGEIEKRIAALEARLGVLEDHIALYQSVSFYGPAVDSLQHEDAVGLWTEDGQYVGDNKVMNGREIIKAMLDGDAHRGFVAEGCAHTMSLPLLRIDGDRAIGLGYHKLDRHGPEGFYLFRLVVSRWDWVRINDCWKVVKRVHRLLDGSKEARALLRDTLAEINAP